MNSNMANAGLKGAALAGARVALPRDLDLRTLAVAASKGALALFDLDKGLALVVFLVAMWFSNAKGRRGASCHSGNAYVAGWFVRRHLDHSS
jgi:hypothetical protein